MTLLLETAILAARSGGDVLLAQDPGQDLQTLIVRAQPGQAIKLTVIRQGKRVPLQVILTERPAARP